MSVWAIYEQESCSDLNIMKYGLWNPNTITQPTVNNKGGVRYRVEERDIAKFQGCLIEHMEQLQNGMHKERVGREGLDEHLSQKVAAATCMEAVIGGFQEALETDCRFSFRMRIISHKVISKKSVPCWTQNLTILREKVNAQRR